MTQKLITAAITNASKKFGLYSQDGKRGQAVVLARFFTPASNMTWYMTEFDPETGDGFGVVVGCETEWGYFNVNEMQNAKMQSGFSAACKRSSETSTLRRRSRPLSSA